MSSFSEETVMYITLYPEGQYLSQLLLEDSRTDNQGTDVLPITLADNANAVSFTYDDLLKQ